MIPGRGGVSALIKVFPLSSEQCIGVIASYTLDLLLLFLAYTKKRFFCDVNDWSATCTNDLDRSRVISCQQS